MCTMGQIMNVGRRGPTPSRKTLKGRGTLQLRGRQSTGGRHLLQGSAIFKGEMRKVNQVIELTQEDILRLAVQDAGYWAKRVWAFSGFPDLAGTTGDVVDMRITKEPK